MLQAAKLCVISGCRDWASFGRSSSGRSLLPRGNQHRLCWSWITLKESRATQCYQCQSCCFLPVSPTCGQRLAASSPAVLPLGEFHITSWRWPQLGSVGFCPLIVWKIRHLHDNIHSTLKHKKKNPNTTAVVVRACKKSLWMQWGSSSWLQDRDVTGTPPRVPSYSDYVHLPAEGYTLSGFTH